MAVLPIRAYKPKDKALVAGAVRIVYQRIHARLRQQTFRSLEQLNTAIWPLLEEGNHRKLSGRGRPYSRRQFFAEVEAPTLSGVPAERFEIRSYSQVTVLQNGHVHFKEDRHYDSVPYRYIRKKVRIAYTSKQVKIFYKYDCIAIHQRTKGRYNYTTDSDHLASTHKQYTKWNAEFFLKWAASINPDVETLITRILDKKQHPEPAYRTCVGVLVLDKKVGRQRFIEACALSLEHQRYSYNHVQDILERSLGKLSPPQENTEPLPTHRNIRGQSYCASKSKKHHE